MLELIFRKHLGFLLIFLLLFGAGLVLFNRLAIQLYPRTNRPSVSITIRHDGYSATDFSAEYASSIEPKLMAVNGVDLLEVRYGNNQSSFTIRFSWDIDAMKAKTDTESALAGINALLPSDLQGTSRVRFSTGENAGYLIVGLNSPSVSPEDLYRRLTANVEPKLVRVKDAEVIEVFNVEDIRAQVTLRQEDMLKYGLTINDVNSGLRVRMTPQSVGRLRESSGTMSVNYSRHSIGLLDIGNIPISEQENFTVRLKDIADISISYTIPQATFIVEGARSVQITATPVNGGNIRSMSQEVTKILREARESGAIPEDTEIRLLLDPAEYINRSIDSVVRATVIGAILAMIIILVTLAELKNTLVIGISLPVSLVLSFILMYVFNISLNLISLGGMALAVGMIVDSSIVVMENIHRFRMESTGAENAGTLRTLIVRAVAQVRVPVIASTLTSVLVFLPISFTAPLTNAILGDQAKVVVFTLLFSLAVSLTLIPLLAFLLFRKRRSNGMSDHERLLELETRPEHPLHHPRRMILAGMNVLDRTYAKLLRAVISRRTVALGLILLSTAALSGSIFFILPRIPREIISPPSSDRLIIFMQSTEDITSQEIVEKKIPEMDAIIKENLSRYVSGTYAEVRGRMNRLFLILKSTQYANTVTTELQKLFPSDNDWYYNIMNWDPAQLPLPRTNDLQINIHGPDPALNVALLERMRTTISEMGLYAWVNTVPATNFAEALTLSPRQGVMNRIQGYGENTLLSIIQRALVGTQSVSFEYDGRSVGVNAAYPDSVIRGKAAFENFLLPYEQSAIPLKHFFDFAHSTTVSQIASENGEPIYRIYATMPRGTAASNRAIFESKVKEALSEKIQVSPDTAVEFENPQLELDEAIRSLFLSLALSIALIYLLLAFQFNSLVIPLVILVAIPLGFIGLIMSLFIFKSTLSLNSMLGAILLSGIVVNNSIILIDFYRGSLKNFSNRIDALVETARIRFRPIFITTATTIVGMLPIAIGLGEGSNVVKPLGIAISGGLFISTLLTLFVVPSILSLIRLKAEE